jgi:hypothetical protein
MNPAISDSGIISRTGYKYIGRGVLKTFLKNKQEMRRIFTIIFYLISCTCYGQSDNMDIYGIIGGGFDESIGTLMPESRYRDYNYFMNTVPVTSPGIYAGLQAHLLNRWQFSVNLRFSRMGSSFRYHDFPLNAYNTWITGRNKSQGFVRKGMYNNDSIITTGWTQNFMRISVTEEFNFYQLRFKKGVLNHFGINLNAGVGLDYNFILKKYRKDSLWDFKPLSVGSVSVRGLEKQNRSGAGGILAGLNAQFIYKEKRYLKFGVWYQYIPHPNISYLMNLSYDGKEDDFKLYCGRQQLIFFVEIPIKLFSISRRD